MRVQAPFTFSDVGEIAVLALYFGILSLRGLSVWVLGTRAGLVRCERGLYIVCAE